MAIEFNCPYCTSPVRVPDTAGGKRGTCPKCNSKIIVPHVQPPAPEPASPAPSAPPPVAIQDELPEATELVDDVTSTPSRPGPPPLPPPLPGQTAAASPAPAPPAANAEPAIAIPNILLSTDTEQAPPTTSIAKKYKKRRKRNNSAIMVPLAFGSLLVGAVVWFLMQTTVELEGTLTAQTVGDDPTYHGVIKSDSITVNSNEVEFVMDSLEETPLSIASARMATFVSSSRGDLDFEIRAAGREKFYKIKYTQNAVLRDWVGQNAEKLNKPRLKMIADHVNDFVADVEDARRKDEKGSPANLMSYRDQLAFAAMTRGFGFNVAARVNSTLYPCVHEDAENNIYFLLPDGISGFTIEGRKLATGNRIFTGKYKVKVAKAGAKSKADKADEDEG